MNPFDGLAKYLLGRLEQKILQNWLKLLFEIAFSGAVTFLLVTGGSLIGGGSFALGIGSGMTLAAVVMTVVFRRSPMTAGMLVVLPAKEAEVEINSDLQTIERPNVLPPVVTEWQLHPEDKKK